jgi:hypothetical protein
MLMAKRDIFGELMEGAAAMKSHRGGKLTLRGCAVHEQCSPPDYASTKKLWKNGSKAVRSRTFRRRLSSFLSADTLIP